ncbi:MAG: T9SS type A sorting domain-containing protein [bacterium]
MKKLMVLFIFVAFSFNAFAQNPSYQEKLYYTCKVWGFTKYFHSQVNQYKVNWDSVLVNYLPEIKNAETTEEFNDKLLLILQSAGQMDIATTTSPDTLPPELKKNLRKDWSDDNVIRSDIKEILDTIYNNFRPRAGCWANTSGASGYYFTFPLDDPIIDTSFSVTYPDEYNRILCICKYWNIINYFYPYNNILPEPWDSTLYEFIEQFANAPTYSDFYYTFKRMTAKLGDAHVEGLTWSQSFPPEYYSPKLILRYTTEGYAVVKSGYTSIKKGDVIISVDGKTTQQWEDSLSQFISAGNPNVLRRYICSKLLRGETASPIEIVYKDSLEQEQTLSTYRYNYLYNSWFYYYPNEELDTIKWRKWDCNVGYVNMGILESSDIIPMYNDLKNTSSIIFDIRNYPNGTAWSIGEKMYLNSTQATKLLVPDTRYPGTYKITELTLGFGGNTNGYRGKVIILCDQQTQSQAEYSCMILRAMPDAVVVGSQTAGADGDISAFDVCPGFQTGFSSIGVYYPDGTETQRVGIIPDSIVFPSPEGIRQGKDEVLEKALEIAGCILDVEDNKITNDDITIYPNPASEYIEIKLSESSELSESYNIQIYNMLGECVSNLTPTLSKGEGVFVVDISNLPVGMYFLAISSGEKNIERMKFIILR